jgi:hypothetical protein
MMHNTINHVVTKVEICTKLFMKIQVFRHESSCIKASDSVTKITKTHLRASVVPKILLGSLPLVIRERECKGGDRNERKGEEERGGEGREGRDNGFGNMSKNPGYADGRCQYLLFLQAI